MRTIQQDGKVKEVLSVLSSHPSLTGMVFSIVTQYCGKAVVLSENGKITFQKLPAYYTIGDTNAEKLVCALLYWLFYLAADEAASKRHIIDGLGLSKVLLKKIKEFANFSFMKSFLTISMKQNSLSLIGLKKLLRERNYIVSRRMMRACIPCLP